MVFVATQFEWKIAMKDHPAVRGTFLETEVHAKYIKSYMTGIPDYDMLTTRR